MLKQCEEVPVVYPAGSSVADFDLTWWVAHTKPRQEKAFARDLLAKDISYFLPLREKVSVSRGRKLRSLLPLFPSYVFVCSDGDDRSDFYRNGRLVRVLTVPDQKTLQSELCQLHKALEGTSHLSPWRFLPEGSRCRVHSGPLRGVEGLVDRHRGAARLVLKIDMLGQAVALEIDAGLLEPAG